MLEKLNKEICFIDLETTGLDPKNDRIVKISIRKRLLDGTFELKSRLINPEIEIPNEASEIHNITNDTIKDAPTFKQVSKGILNYISNSVIVTYRGRVYDNVLLYSEFLRSEIKWDYSKNIFIDSYELYIKNEPRTLCKAYEYYTGKEYVDNRLHDSDYDTEILVDVFNEQLKKYYSDGIDLEKLTLDSNNNKRIVDIDGKFYVDENGDFRYNFGKAKDTKIEENEWQLGYILSGNYHENTKMFAEFFLNKIKNNK